MSREEPFDAYGPTRTYIAAVIRGREEALAFFAPGEDRQFARECWCAATFLRDLGVDFDEGELTRRSDDVTVDVFVKGARLQVKEIMGSRLRTKELKDSLRIARKEQESSQPNALALVEPFELAALTPADIVGKVSGHMDAYVAGYPNRSDRAALDLLVYVNFEATTMDEGVPEVPQWIALGWRSVSVVTNDGSIVLCASESAPTFIRNALGQGRMKRKPQEFPGNTHIRIRFADDRTTVCNRSVLSRAESALHESLKRCGLDWSIDWSPDQDLLEEPEVAVCWGLVDPDAIDATLPKFRAALEGALHRHQLRVVEFGPAMP